MLLPVIVLHLDEHGDVSNTSFGLLGSIARGAVLIAEQLLSDKTERFITDESPEREQGEAAILKFLAHDDVPRQVKRTVNHLRLLLLVANKRGMFGGSPQLEAVHLGKWIVLLERWPELGHALRANPRIMAPIETAARTDPRALQDLLHSIVPEVAPSPDLTAFLKDETRLADLVERLIYYLPAHNQSPLTAFWRTLDHWLSTDRANEEQRQELPQEPDTPVP